MEQFFTDLGLTLLIMLPICVVFNLVVLGVTKFCFYLIDRAREKKNKKKSRTKIIKESSSFINPDYVADTTVYNYEIIA